MSSFLINPFIFTTSAPSCSGDLISISGLKAYYNFNGSVIDYSGNGRVAIPTSITYTSSGKFSSGGTFNGSSSRAVMPSANYDIANAQTMMAWIYITSSTIDGQILSMDTVASDRCWQFGLGSTASKPYYIRFNAAQSIVANFTTPSSLAINQWNHVAVTFSTTNGSRIYVNGVTAATDSNTTATRNSTNQPIIGSFNGGTGSFFPGIMDEVSMWNRELSAAEIALAYSATCPIRSTIMTANTVGYYAFEANENDSTPNARTLTNTSVTWAPGKGGTYSAAFITGSTLVDSATKKLTTSTQIVETVSTSTSGLSVSGWFSLANLPSQVGYTSIAWILAGTSQRGIWLEYTQAGAWRLVFFDGATQYTNAWTTTPTLNQWYHICFVMQPSTGVFNVYFDGVSRISGTNTNNGNSGFSNRLTIGSYDSVARTWLGYIDEFAIWSRPLAYNEVQNLYNSGAGDYYPFTS